MRYIRLFWFVTVLPLLAVPAAAQSTDAYMAPPEFMNLFFDFTGTEEPDYPAGQPTLGQMLTQSVIAREVNAPGPLVLVVGSDIYVYESRGGTLLGHARFRADRTSGFYELTAISHIGPALAYLAQIKENGDCAMEDAPRLVAGAYRASTRAQPARHEQLARSLEPACLERAQGTDPQHGRLCLRPYPRLYRLARRGRWLHRHRRE